MVPQSAAAVSVLILSPQHKLQHQPAHLSTCQILLKTTSMMQFCSTRQFIRSESTPPLQFDAAPLPADAAKPPRSTFTKVIQPASARTTPASPLRRWRDRRADAKALQVHRASSANGAFHHHISEQSEDLRDELVCGQRCASRLKWGNVQLPCQRSAKKQEKCVKKTKKPLSSF